MWRQRRARKPRSPARQVPPNLQLSPVGKTRRSGWITSRKTGRAEEAWDGSLSHKSRLHAPGLEHVRTPINAERAARKSVWREEKSDVKLFNFAAKCKATKPVPPGGQRFQFKPRLGSMKIDSERPATGWKRFAAKFFNREVSFPSSPPDSFPS